MPEADCHEPASRRAVYLDVHCLPALQRAKEQKKLTRRGPSDQNARHSAALRAASPWLLVLAIVGLDQATKALIRAQFAPAESLPLIPSVLHLTYIQNTGAAFGLFRGHGGLFVLASVATISWIVWELRRPSHRRFSVILSLSLILGGAVGNIIDRVWLGYVVDFIDVRVWPVFNVADSCISVGVGLLLLSQTRRRRPQRTVSDTGV